MFKVNVSLASTAEYSSEAAESIKDLNPNAADILITSVITSMVTDLGVVAPTASGLLTYYDGEKNSTHSVDGYFVAPKKFGGNDHEEHRISMTYGGHVETCKGANTFAVPGIYKILDLIFKRYASLPLDKLLEFPIKTAKEGFKLTQPTKDYFIHSLEPMFMWHEESKIALSNVYEDLDNGTVKLDKLSDTLNHMSDEGFNDFYIGDISKSIVETLKLEGGHAVTSDFNNYDIIEDNKFVYQYKDLKLTGHSGPSIGGLMVLKYLKALSIESQNIEETLQNIYLDRQNNYEFFWQQRRTDQ